MSTHQGPRRRRIAGERRRADEVVTDGTSAEPAQVGPVPAQAGGSEVPEATKATKPPKAARAGTPWPRFAAVAAVAVGLVTAALVLGLVAWDVREVRRADRVEQAGESASAAAERAATAALSYQYDTLDADLESATRFMTESFAKEFSDTFDAFVRPNAPKQRAKVSAEVLATGVITGDEDRVEVLVYVDQTTESTANPEPSVALNRTSFDMVERDGSWLVDGFHSY